MNKGAPITGMRKRDRIDGTDIRPPPDWTSLIAAESRS
jgi:hypothetical protein